MRWRVEGGVRWRVEGGVRCVHVCVCVCVCVSLLKGGRVGEGGSVLAHFKDSSQFLRGQSLNLLHKERGWSAC